MGSLATAEHMPSRPSVGSRPESRPEATTYFLESPSSTILISSEVVVVRANGPRASGKRGCSSTHVVGDVPVTLSTEHRLTLASVSFLITSVGSERKPLKLPIPGMYDARAASRIIATCWKHPWFTAFRQVSSTQKSSANPHTKTRLQLHSASLRDWKRSRPSSTQANASGGAFMSGSGAPGLASSRAYSIADCFSSIDPVQGAFEQPMQHPIVFAAAVL
mmetsp:Transcript_35830/g.94138  ORF Transcript_35830/g.94138 Transcript_35830/m.94138 type:complete len:220 (+) Transcript_35830:853-1512(+)